MSATTDEILEKLKSLTLLEAAELVKQIEETFEVSAAGGGGMMMMAPGAIPGGGSAAAEPEEEKTEFDVVLEEFPADKKIKVLKAVREITGLGLKEAKEVVESVPKPIKEGVSKEEAADAEAKLKAVDENVKVIIK